MIEMECSVFTNYFVWCIGLYVWIIHFEDEIYKIIEKGDFYCVEILTELFSNSERFAMINHDNRVINGRKFDLAECTDSACVYNHKPHVNFDEQHFFNEFDEN